jgi:hypothetical protein
VTVFQKTYSCEIRLSAPKKEGRRVQGSGRFAIFFLLLLLGRAGTRCVYTTRLSSSVAQ